MSPSQSSLQLAAILDVGLFGIGVAIVGALSGLVLAVVAVIKLRNDHRDRVFGRSVELRFRGYRQFDDAAVAYGEADSEEDRRMAWKALTKALVEVDRCGSDTARRAAKDVYSACENGDGVDTREFGRVVRKEMNKFLPPACPSWMLEGREPPSDWEELEETRAWLRNFGDWRGLRRRFPHLWREARRDFEKNR